MNFMVYKLYLNKTVSKKMKRIHKTSLHSNFFKKSFGVNLTNKKLSFDTVPKTSEKNSDNNNG